jgi:hypothetical protein
MMKNRQGERIQEISLEDAIDLVLYYGTRFNLSFELNNVSHTRLRSFNYKDDTPRYWDLIEKGSDNFLFKTFPSKNRQE